MATMNRSAEGAALDRGSPASAAIGSSVKILGQVFGSEDLSINGQLEGTVEVSNHTVTIGPEAVLHASVRALHVLVLGEVHGNIEAAERLEIRRDAKVLGDVKTARIVIEDGAYFKGSIDILKGRRIRTFGSPEAQAADEIAEQEIREGRYTTLRSPRALADTLTPARPATAAPAAAEAAEAKPAVSRRS